MSGSILPKTLLLAEDESRRGRTFFVGTEHLFLAIARQGGPQVERLLAQHGVTLDEATARARQLVAPWKPDENWSGLLQHTPRVRRIARRALYLAERDGGKAPEGWHYLTALLEEPLGHTARAVLGYVKPDAAAEPPVESAEAPAAVSAEADGLQLDFEPADAQGPKQAGPGRRSALAHFGRDLTGLAQQGKLPPFIGGEQSIELLIRTLSRQTKPNPLIVGEPGTGKTALVEGLAQRLAAGHGPPALRSARIIELSLNSLVAGTQYRGEFEQRLERILAEAAARPEVILFLDEFHQAIGAGATGSGSMDAANVLKPALARGELRCIAATTLREYRKYIEPDAALSRRFQVIVLNDPDEPTTLAILRGLRERFEAHHGVRIGDDALTAAVRLSTRFESERHQPDKSIDLLDDACTRVALAVASDAGEKKEVGSETQPTVMAEHVAQAVSERTGIPVSSLTSDELQRLAGLEQALARVIQGQDDAVSAVAGALREMRLGLREENRPQAVFLFAGPTGVGKTALAEALAREFFGLPESLQRLDMSEYMEPHSVSRLIGAPPGYVGHEEQGQLTKALRARPHSLVLLDEIEKAHPQVCDIFLQVFGSGRLTDGRGDVVDCRQAMFVMTSNLGSEAYGGNVGLGFQSARRDPRERLAEQVEAVREACRKHFRPEMLNRIDRIICFNPLPPAVLRTILDRLVEEMQRHLQARGVEIEVTEAARQRLVAEAGVEQGVPPLKRLLRERILHRVAQFLVTAAGGGLLRVKADAAEGEIRLEKVGDET